AVAGEDARHRRGRTIAADPGPSPAAHVSEERMPSSPPSVAADPWTRLRQHTAARIALGRSGASLPTAEVLRFALDHALARDAVHAELDVDQLEKDLAAIVTAQPVVRAS